MNQFLLQFADKTFERPGKALDLGAGDFSDVQALEGRGWICEGVDIKTGTDLEKSYLSKDAPFDLVYSNYVIQEISNKPRFICTIYDNLRSGGWMFLHTFDSSDKSTSSGLDKSTIKSLLEDKFKNIKTRVFDYYDNEEGHKHWHRILEVVAQRV